MFGSLKMPLNEAFAVAIIGLVTVISILAVIACLILLVSKIIRAIEAAVSKKSDKPAVEAAISSPVASAPVYTGPVLENVDDKEAAVIMAIVSDKSGIPLEKLNFRSIKLIGDEKKGEVK